MIMVNGSAARTCTTIERNATGRIRMHDVMLK